MCYGVLSSILLRMRIYYKQNTCRVHQDSPGTGLFIEKCHFFLFQVKIVQRF